MGDDRCAYIISNDQNEIIALRAYQLSALNIQQLKKIFTEDAILTSNFKKCNVGYFSSKLTLIPEAYFDLKQANDILSSTSDLLPEEIVLTNKLPFNEANILFALDKEVEHQLKTQFKCDDLYALSTGMLVYYHKFLLPQSGFSVFVNFFGRYMMATVFNDDRLIFHNILAYTTAKECLYFVMQIYHQFDLDTHQLPVTLTGDITKNSEIYKLCYKYIKTIYMPNRPSFYHYGSSINEKLDTTFFQDLFSLKLCAS